LVIPTFQLLNCWSLEAQIKVGTATGASTNTYNITNSGDNVTTEATGGNLRVAQRQFIDVGNAVDLANALSVATGLTGGGVVRVTNTQTILSNVTVPANVMLYVARNGRINKTNITDSLLVKGEFYAGTYQSFDSTLRVRMWPGSVPTIRPEWWGALGDSLHDDGVAINAAITAIPRKRSGGRIDLTAGSIYKTSQTITFPSDTDVRNLVFEGNGAKIVYTGTTKAIYIFGATTGGTPNVGPRAQREGTRHWIRNLTLSKTFAGRGTGDAITLEDCVQQKITGVLVRLFNRGIHFSITGNFKWVEGCFIEDIELKGCRTGLEFTAVAGGTNSESFRNNWINHVTIGDIQFGKLAGTDTSYGIRVNRGANLYNSNLESISIFPQDTMVCVYWNGRAHNTKGQIKIEAVDRDTSVVYWRFGTYSKTNWFNTMKWDLVGEKGDPGSKLFLFDANSETYNAIQGLISQSPVTLGSDPSVDSHRGLEHFLRPGTFSRIRSMTFPSATSFNNGLVYVEDVNSDSTMIFRMLRSKPAEFRSIEAGSVQDLLPVRLLDIGRNRVVNDVLDSLKVISVRNVTHLNLGSGASNPPAAIDSLRAFVNGTVGQTLTVQFVDDSVYIYNLLGGTGRIFTSSNLSFRAPSGYRATFKAEQDETGIFWRVQSESWPVKAFTYNPPSVAADSSWVVSVTYFGAAAGTPALATHSSVTGKWILYAYGSGADQVTVVGTNKRGGTEDLASGILRVTIVK
jgi:hypothetical protein